MSVINVCFDCDAVREYPSGKPIYICPRCGGNNVKQVSTQSKERDRHLVAAIKGTLAKELKQKINAKVQ